MSSPDYAWDSADPAANDRNGGSVPKRPAAFDPGSSEELSESAGPQTFCLSEATLNTITRHASLHSKSRMICIDAIDATVRFAEVPNRRGPDFSTIGGGTFAAANTSAWDVSRWIRAKVISARSGEVITLYRNNNQQALRNIGPIHDAV